MCVDITTLVGLTAGLITIGEFTYRAARALAHWWMNK